MLKKLLSKKEFYIWLSVTLFIPFLAPILLALLFNMLEHTGNGFLDYLKMFWFSGAYVFLGLFSLLSLIPHFSENKKLNRTTERIYTISTAVILLMTCFLFLSSLDLMPGENAVSFEDNLYNSIIIFVISVVVASVIKIIALHKEQIVIN